MSYKHLLLEKQGPVATVTFNRPEALNALNSELLKELGQMVDEIESDDSVYVAVFTGQGKSFIAGADISEMSDLGAVEGQLFGALGQSVFLKVENMLKPTIAAVNGFALGGGMEFAMSCDIRVASEKAKFGQPEVGLGITPGFSGTQRLPKLIGLGKAKELIFTGKMIGAAEALELGLVNSIYEPEKLLDKAREMAEQIATNAQIAVRLSKKAINEGYNKDIATGNNLEAGYFGLCFSTEDQKSGMKAFLNKEKASFKCK